MTGQFHNDIELDTWSVESVANMEGVIIENIGAANDKVEPDMFTFTNV